MHQKRFNEDQIMSYGREVASMWGAECLDYKSVVGKDKDGKSKIVIRYFCCERGEYFTTDVDLKEVER